MKLDIIDTQLSTSDIDPDVSDASWSTCTCVRVRFAVLLLFSRHFPSDLRCGLQESEGGLYVCMNTFLGFGREHVERHYRKTGQSVYMHLKRHVKEVRATAVQEFSEATFKSLWKIQFI